MCSICEPGKDPQAARVRFHGRMAKPQLVKLCQSAQAPGALLQPSLRISQPGSSCPAWPCSPEPAASRSVPITGRWKWGTAPRTPPPPTPSLHCSGSDGFGFVLSVLLLHQPQR